MEYRQNICRPQPNWWWAGEGFTNKIISCPLKGEVKEHEVLQEMTSSQQTRLHVVGRRTGAVGDEPGSRASKHQITKVLECHAQTSSDGQASEEIVFLQRLLTGSNRKQNQLRSQKSLLLSWAPITPHHPRIYIKKTRVSGVQWYRQSVNGRWERSGRARIGCTNLGSSWEN